MGEDPAAGWKGLQGGFGQDVSISTTKAVIVKGQIEFVGADADAEYTPIRYALTYQDSNSTLQNALTDSATWFMLVTILDMASIQETGQAQRLTEVVDKVRSGQ